jgi:hypothetical protein
MAKTTPDRVDIVAGAVKALHEPRYLAEQLVAALQANAYPAELIEQAKALLAAIEAATT